MDLAVNNLQRLVCHKPQTTNENVLPKRCINKFKNEYNSPTFARNK